MPALGLDQRTPTANRAPSQFSLRSLFLAITAIAVGLGLAKWFALLGVAVTVVGLVRCLAAAGLVILSFALVELIWSSVSALAFGRQRDGDKLNPLPIGEAGPVEPT